MVPQYLFPKRFRIGLVDRLVGRLPDRGTLRLDANGGLDIRAAERWLDAAEDWPVEFIEQPLAVDATIDLVRLAADHRVPVAIDESGPPPSVAAAPPVASVPAEDASL